MDHPKARCGGFHRRLDTLGGFVERLTERPREFGVQWITVDFYFWEYAQFMTLVAGNGKGKSKAKAKEALVFTPSKHVMKVVSADATMTPHMLAWNDVNQVSIPCHVNGDHWMLADVHLLLRTITIYDSH
ncbi:hypothetical protein FF1_006919 [Malus domestica]